MKPTKKTVVILSFALIFGLASIDLAHTEAADVLSLSGNDWRLCDDPQGDGEQRRMYDAVTDGEAWIAATVPGNIQADVEGAHRLRPLWYGDIDPALYELARKDWWYRKDFVIPKSYEGRRISLRFDGVDDRCKVWLNGRPVGQNGGTFRRFWLDVSDVALPGQTNRLAVRIERMPEELVPYLIDSDAADSGGGPNDPHWFVHGINRTRQLLKDLKSPGVWSYDWSTNVWTLGIWKGVQIEATGPVRIAWTRVETTLDDDHNEVVKNPSPERAGVITVSRGANTFSKATVHATLEVDSTIAGPVQAKIRVHGPNADVSTTVDAVLVEGPNRIKAVLSLDHPELWWPNGQGDQPLYRLEAEVQPSGGATSDRSSTRFGVRQLRWVRTESQPVEAYLRTKQYTKEEYDASNYQLLVNGRPVRGFGSAFILPYILPGCGNAHERRLLHLAKNAGMNLLRTNGGGGAALFDDAWFDLADELGIMIAYEYPAGNSLMEDDPAFLANLDASCRNMIKQVRNHPSVIQYLGGNEMAWGRSQGMPALQLMQKIAAEESDRLFRATDPEADNKHGPYWFDILQSKETYSNANGHYRVDSQASRCGYRYYNSTDSDTMWYGELGTTSPANLEIWHRFIPPASQWPLDNAINDPVLIHHNAMKAVGGESWLFKSRIEALMGKADSLHDLVAAGQFYGAEGLRYLYDALRRKGKRIGGITNHCYGEPWPNAAGSYMVDFDGRPLMNYDFLKQALAPISLSLKMDSILYDAETGIQPELWLVSDAPQSAKGLRAKWLARDRKGDVFARGDATADIDPGEVKSLGSISLHPPQQTIEGPVFVELQLTDAAGKLLTERVQFFGNADMACPLAGLLKKHAVESPPIPAAFLLTATASCAENLAYVGNGAKPATASSSLPIAKHQPAGVNDGRYGNEHSWIGKTYHASFQIDLGISKRIGRFKIGRDREGLISDRPIDYLKVETSPDGQSWETAFESSRLMALENASPSRSLVICIAPVTAQFVRATVDAPKRPQRDVPCVDEFEVFAPAEEMPSELPQCRFLAKAATVFPIGQATLKVTSVASAAGQDVDVLSITLKNTGAMTALFCEPHPMLVYRTDLYIDNNNCFIPPGEERTITIRAAKPSNVGLSLAQTGWTVSAWNAADVVIAPEDTVLLSVGRRDAMCREFNGCNTPASTDSSEKSSSRGARPDAGAIAYRLDSAGNVRFTFDCPDRQLGRKAKLRIHTADQSEAAETRVAVTINGRTMEKTSSKGLGIQKTQPAHLAFPAMLEFDLLPSDLHGRPNELTIRVDGDGWFSWDSMDLTVLPAQK